MFPFWLWDEIKFRLAPPKQLDRNWFALFFIDRFTKPLIAFSTTTKSYQCQYCKHYWNHLFQSKAYLITLTNSLTFSNTKECSAVKQNFTSWAQLGTDNFTIFLLFALKMAIIIPTNFIGKHLEFMEISLETVIWGNYYVNIADFGMKKWKMAQISLRSLLSSESRPFSIWNGFKVLNFIFLGLGLKL